MRRHRGPNTPAGAPFQVDVSGNSIIYDSSGNIVDSGGRSIPNLPALLANPPGSSTVGCPDLSNSANFQPATGSTTILVAWTKRRVESSLVLLHNSRSSHKTSMATAVTT